MPYICKLLPKWWNFSKSGHTGKDLPKRVLTKESVSAPLWGANLNHWMAYKTNLLKSHSCQSKTVWPNGLIISSIFGHIQWRKVAQGHKKLPNWVQNLPNVKLTIKIVKPISENPQIWSRWLYETYNLISMFGLF